MILEINRVKEWMKDYSFWINDALDFNNTFVLVSDEKWKLVLTRISDFIWFEVHTSEYEYEFSSLNIEDCLIYINENIDKSLHFF